VGAATIAGRRGKIGIVYKEEDTVVPRANLVPLLVGAKEIARRYGIRTVCYGHAATATCTSTFSRWV
jgi:FAD/FMN-containing dehydrogenase